MHCKIPPKRKEKKKYKLVTLTILVGSSGADKPALRGPRARPRCLAEVNMVIRFSRGDVIALAGSPFFLRFSLAWCLSLFVPFPPFRWPPSFSRHSRDSDADYSRRLMVVKFAIGRRFPTVSLFIRGRRPRTVIIFAAEKIRSRKRSSEEKERERERERERKREREKREKRDEDETNGAARARNRETERERETYGRITRLTAL